MSHLKSRTTSCSISSTYDEGAELALSIDALSINGFTASDTSNVFVQDFDPGTDDVETSDLPNPVFNDTYMGVDFYRGPTWTFTFACLGSTEREVMNNVASLKAAWRNETTAKKAGALTALKFNLAGEERTVYGRPRRFACNPTRTIVNGYATAQADFVLADPIIYSGASKTQTLNSAPPLSVGLKEPLLEPLTVGGTGGVRQGVIEDTGGEAPAVFVVRVYGPGSDPWFSIDGHKYSFPGLSLAGGKYLNVDSRLGTATYNGANQLSRMSPRSRLKGVRLPASKSCEITFGINDSTGLARCEFWWNPAHYTL
ncbi:hypothetical protein [Brevibacterium moorei]|uniref:hypothetical protein n=1 Tax=Brevibacterium moorei TaxID=2968457 RepID=UPI00211B8CA7|nr:hypothetical protein [Brevibacterium sp. 68QC2CO]MCQ9385114.1 hypothetical protein [Brevibacterium sp. 68QC2CO]